MHDMRECLISIDQVQVTGNLVNQTKIIFKCLMVGHYEQKRNIKGRNTFWGDVCHVFQYYAAITITPAKYKRERSYLRC